MHAEKNSQEKKSKKNYGKLQEQKLWKSISPGFGLQHIQWKMTVNRPKKCLHSADKHYWRNITENNCGKIQKLRKRWFIFVSEMQWTFLPKKATHNFKKKRSNGRLVVFVCFWMLEKCEWRHPPAEMNIFPIQFLCNPPPQSTMLFNWIFCYTVWYCKRPPLTGINTISTLFAIGCSKFWIATTMAGLARTRCNTIWSAFLTVVKGIKPWGFRSMISVLPWLSLNRQNHIDGVYIFER